jgi:hypothetical protein
LSENCFEPVRKGGWPPISTWITKEDSSSLEEDEDSESDTKRVLFMSLEDFEEDFAEEGEVYLIAKLINAFDDLKNERNKIKSLKEGLKRK